MKRPERIGYDSIRELTYIRPAVMRDDRTEPRCPTCGRAFDCACGPECPCPVGKEQEETSWLPRRHLK